MNNQALFDVLLVSAPNGGGLFAVRGVIAKVCGAAVLVSCKTSRLPSSNATVACVQ